MKKWLAVFCAALMGAACLGLAACGKDNSKDWEYIEEKGEMIVGYTNYDPFAYEEGGKLVGFDVELAEAVAAKLGIKVKFQLINWKAKVTELNGRSIDVIWNAMTITDELKKQISISEPYVNNVQAVVVKSENAAKYATKELIKSSGKAIALEEGSSADVAVKGDAVLAGVSITGCNDQNAALLEVSSGASDIAVVDTLLFDSLTAKGGSVVNGLVKIEAITFPAEQFGIGVRKGSNFLAKLNEALDALKEDGTYAEIAAKYNMTNMLVKD